MSKKWVSIFCFIFMMVTTVVWAKPDSAYIDNGNGTVTDIETKLMWQQATAGKKDWYKATDYCKDLRLAGYTDWRLPTLDELKTLLDISWGNNPTINRTFFPGTVSSFYWSSNTSAYNTNDAWGVNFYYGNDYMFNKYSSLYVRAVRGGQPGSLDNLVISPTSRSVSNDAGSTSFDVSNTGTGITGIIPWKAAVTSDSSWLTITSGNSGTNTGVITCGYTANTSTSSRTGTIRVTAYGDGSTSTQKDVTVTQASSIYVDNGNGTVTDTSSSLIWQQATAPNTYNRDQAISYCESLSFAGYTDWRLPTLDELKTIVDSTQTPPKINHTFFPDTRLDVYWSSTTYADSTNGAWGVDFFYGGGYSYVKGGSYYVRAVRGGQPKPTACTATIDGNSLLHIPYLSYIDPVSKTLSFWADLVNEVNPMYPRLILFKLTILKIIDYPSFSCEASTLSSDFKIHIPDVVLLPDGITHLWVDMEYFPALSTDENVYFEVKKYGVISN